MSFTVLTNDEVNHILMTLSPSDVADLVQALEQALIQYSCHNEQVFQPHRAVVKRPDEQVTLFMPATTQQLVGVKIVGITPSKGVVEVADREAAPRPGLKSALTLCDSTGQAIGVLNAAELTAFRTALGSMLMYRFRHTTKNVVVFGAGKQALWHIRLAILLRGKDIDRVTIVNRSSQRTEQLVETLRKSRHLIWPSHIKLEVFDGQDKRDAALETLVTEADVLFFTTPSTVPLFPASFLTTTKARSKTRFIAAIGSYRLDMQEIDPELLKMVVDPTGLFAEASYQAGAVAVDSRAGCLDEAGELVKAEVPAEKMLEIGTLLHSRNSHDSSELDRWLENGFVIYKSVGIGVMDLAIGHQLLHLSKAMNTGSTIEDF